MEIAGIAVIAVIARDRKKHVDLLSSCSPDALSA
jgi:hypothetical protein